MSIIQSIFHLVLHIVWVKTTGVLHVHRWNTFLMLLDLSQARPLRVFSMKPFYRFLRVLHTFSWFPRIFILHTAFLFPKIPKLFHHFIPSSNLSRVGNNVALDHPFHLLFSISLYVFGVS